MDQNEKLDRALQDLFQKIEQFEKSKKADLDPLESSDDLGKLFESLAQLQGEMKPAKLDKENPYYNSKYASLQSCQETYRTLLPKYGIALTQQVFSMGENYYIRSILGHKSGQWMASTFRLLVGKKDMQGLGGAVTYGRRYGGNSLLGVADTEDDDGNSSLPPENVPNGKGKADTKPTQQRQKQPPKTQQKPPQKEQKKAPPAVPPKPKTKLEELLELKKTANIPDEAMPDLIKKSTGESKRVKDMTDKELDTLMSYIKMLTK